jgi:HSP20 family protein
VATIDVENRNTEGNRSSLQNWRQERGVSNRGGESSFLSRPYDLFSADPFSMMRHLRDEMDRTFGRFFGNSQESSVENGFWSPAIDVTQRDGELQVHAELPGLKPEDVKVELAADSLVIQGERKVEHEENKGGMYRSERKYGRFYREIPLPEGAMAEQAKAQFNNGVLHVTLPVPEQKSNRRSIPIETASAGQTSLGQASGQTSSSQTSNKNR